MAFRVELNEERNTKATAGSAVALLYGGYSCSEGYSPLPVSFRLMILPMRLRA